LRREEADFSGASLSASLVRASDATTPRDR